MALYDGHDDTGHVEIRLRDAERERFVERRARRSPYHLRLLVLDHLRLLLQTDPGVDICQTKSIQLVFFSGSLCRMSIFVEGV